MDLSVNIALQAVRTIAVKSNGSLDIDIKRYCRIEKIPGGSIEDSKIVKGVVLNKVTYVLIIFLFFLSGYCSSENASPN